MDEAAQRTTDLYWDIHETFYPDDKELRTQSEARLAKESVASWEEAYGRLDDPKVQAGLKDLAEGLEELRRKTVEEQREASQGSMGYLSRELGINPGVGSGRT